MKTTSIPFIKHTPILVTVAAIFTVVGLWILGSRGLQYGTDFLGGTQLQYQFKDVVDEEKIRHALEPLDLKDLTLQRVGNIEEKSISLKFSFNDTPEATARTAKITESLQQAFGTDGVSIRQEAVVGPKVGKELKRNALKAVIVSLILILIYIGFRFDAYFAPAAIICLVHDIGLTLGAISLTGRQFDLTILAAILTIVGYSVNDTIVIFDRIRENIVLYPNLDRATVVNQSINETLSRTIFTTLTVILAVVALYIFGGGVIHDFAFTMIVGVVAGTYSTISISCPCYLLLLRLFPEHEKQANRQ